ncbi:MAG: hypothetical protein ACYC4F_01335 [Armatimonadota bacterium]
MESVRRIKVPADGHPDLLYRRYPDPEELARALIAEDPEVDLELTGRATGSCDRVYVNPDGETIYSPGVMEIRYGPDGTEVERRPRRLRPANTVTHTPPVWSGALIPVDDAIRRYAFTRAYQVMHTNALEYDFLFAIAEYLHERESMLLLGTGRNGRRPLVLERNGPRYRGFMHGRITGDAMRLVLYLSQFELRAPEETP